MKRLAEVKQNDDIPKEQLAQLEAEMQQQDKLLAGYQTENERLYEEMKKLRAVGKAAEEKMFRENQKLKVALANLRYFLQLFAPQNIICNGKTSSDKHGNTGLHEF